MIFNKIDYANSEWGSHAEKAALFRARTGTKSTKLCTLAKRSWLPCAKFQELIGLPHPSVSIRSHILPIIPMLHSRELFEFANPIHCRTSHKSSSKRLPMQHSAYHACPTFMRETHYVASKFSLFRNAVFCPCFHVTRINHFSLALIPLMQNFVPRIPPANPAWNSNQ